MASKKKEEYVEWSCPYCGTKYNAPETATTCPNCGKRFYTSGIEVENKESTKLYEEIKERRKKETEADKERE
jgi:predicted RNA-binding Zn-ribbon protein involved in translation (DUF1610 family)